MTGTAHALGAAGAATGAVVAALVADDRDPMLVASLAGGAAGALGGGFLGAALERRDREGDIRFLLPKPHLKLPGTWAVAPTSVTDGESALLGARLQVTGW